MKRVSATTPPTTAPAIAPPSQLKKYERVSQTPQFEQLEVDVDTPFQVPLQSLSASHEQGELEQMKPLLHVNL